MNCPSLSSFAAAHLPAPPQQICCPYTAAPRSSHCAAVQLSLASATLRRYERRGMATKHRALHGALVHELGQRRQCGCDIPYTNNSLDQAITSASVLATCATRALLSVLRNSLFGVVSQPCYSLDGGAQMTGTRVLVLYWTVYQIPSCYASRPNKASALSADAVAICRLCAGTDTTSDSTGFQAD